MILIICIYSILTTVIFIFKFSDLKKKEKRLREIRPFLILSIKQEDIEKTLHNYPKISIENIGGGKAMQIAVYIASKKRLKNKISHKIKGCLRIDIQEIDKCASIVRNLKGFTFREVFHNNILIHYTDQYGTKYSTEYISNKINNTPGHNFFGIYKGLKRRHMLPSKRKTINERYKKYYLFKVST